MPIMKCQKDGKPGYKWGNKGKCYTYDINDEHSDGPSKKAAKLRATRQGKAIYASNSVSSN